MEDFQYDEISIFVQKFQEENQNSILDAIINQKEYQGQNKITFLESAIRKKEDLNQKIMPVLKYLQNSNLRYGDLKKQIQLLIAHHEQQQLDIAQFQEQIQKNYQKSDLLNEYISLLINDIEKLNIHYKDVESSFQNKISQIQQLKGESQPLQQTQTDKNDIFKKIEKDIEAIQKSKENFDYQNKEIQNYLQLLNQRNINLKKELEKHKSQAQQISSNETLKVDDINEIQKDIKIINKAIRDFKSDNTNFSQNQQDIDKQSYASIDQKSEQIQTQILNSQIVKEQEQKISKLENIKFDMEQRIFELECEINGMKSNEKKISYQISKLEKAISFEKEQNQKLFEEKVSLEQALGVGLNREKKSSNSINQNDGEVSVVNQEEQNLREKNIYLLRDLQTQKQQTDILRETYEKQINQYKIQIEIIAKTNLEKENQLQLLKKNLTQVLKEKDNMKQQQEILDENKNLEGELSLKECKAKLRKYESLFQQSQLEIEIKDLQIHEQHSNQLMEIINIVEIYNKEKLQLTEQLQQQLMLVEQLKIQQESQNINNNQEKDKKFEEQIDKQKMMIQKQKKQIEILQKQNQEYSTNSHSKSQSEQLIQVQQIRTGSDINKHDENSDLQLIINNLKSQIEQLNLKLQIQEQNEYKKEIKLKELLQQILEKDEQIKYLNKSNSFQNTAIVDNQNLLDNSKEKQNQINIIGGVEKDNKQIMELKQQLINNEKVIENLKLQLINCSQQSVDLENIKQLNNQIENLGKQIQIKDVRILELEIIQRTQQKENEQFQQSIQALQANLQELQREKVQLQNLTEILENQSKTNVQKELDQKQKLQLQLGLEGQILFLKKEISRLEEQINVQKKQIEAITINENNLKLQLKQQIEKNDINRNQHEEKEKQLLKEIEKQNQNHSSVMQLQTQKNNELVQREIIQKEQIEYLKKMNQDLQQQYSTLQNQSKEIEGKLNKEIDNQKQQYSQLLQQNQIQLNQQKEKEAKLLEEIENLKQTSQQASQQFNNERMDFQQKQTQLNQQLEYQKQKNLALMQNHESMINQQIQQNVKQEQDNFKNQLNIQKQEQEKVIIQLQQNLKNLEQENESLRQEAKKNEVKLLENSALIKQSLQNEKMQSNTIDQKDKQIQGLQQLNHELTSENNTLIEGNKQQNLQQQIQIDQLNQKISQLVKDCEQKDLILKQEYQGQQEVLIKLSQIKEEKQNLLEIIKNLEIKINHLEQQIIQLQNSTLNEKVQLVDNLKIESQLINKDKYIIQEGFENQKLQNYKQIYQTQTQEQNDQRKLDFQDQKNSQISQFSEEINSNSQNINSNENTGIKYQREIEELKEHIQNLEDFSQVSENHISDQQEKEQKLIKEISILKLENQNLTQQKISIIDQAKEFQKQNEKITHQYIQLEHQIQELKLYQVKLQDTIKEYEDKINTLQLERTQDQIKIVEAEEILKHKIDMEKKIKNQDDLIQKLCQQIGLLEDEHPNEYLAIQKQKIIQLQKDLDNQKIEIKKYQEKEVQIKIYKERLEKKYLEQISELSSHQDDMFSQIKELRSKALMSDQYLKSNKDLEVNLKLKQDQIINYSQKIQEQTRYIDLLEHKVDEFKSQTEIKFKV